MSYAHFLGQTSPFITTQSISLGKQNFITYPVTDTSANVVCPAGEITTVKSIVPPVGYWAYTLNYAGADASNNTINTVFLQVGNGLPLPSDTSNELVVQSSFRGGVFNSALISDTLSGICYSDGSANFNIEVQPDTSGNSPLLWSSYENASSTFGVYPSIQFAKIG